MQTSSERFTGDISLKSALLALVFVLAGSVTQSATLFQDDFEGDLSQWTGKSGGAYHGVIVADPLNPSNDVVVFSELNDTGDMFSTEFAVEAGETYVLSFDYLGLALPDSPLDSFGGFIGISDETPEGIFFLAGTVNVGGILLELIDDGTWHSYSIIFNPADFIFITDGAIRLTMEDWNAAACPLSGCVAGVPGDAFFDNIQVGRTGPVKTEASTWGRIKALYR
jgi:hypothetical protein